MTGQDRFSPFPEAEAVLYDRLDPSQSAPLAVAFSGGGDSLALLLLAARFGRRHHRPVIALTLDHQINPLSLEWTRQAQGMALAPGAEWRGLVWSAPKPATGLAAAARQARHKLLAVAARDSGCQVLLMGHTADDLLETTLMRARDTPGLGAPRIWSPSPVWPQGRGVFVLRPLLSVRRAALRDWLTTEGLDWIDDPANDHPASARARARRALACGAMPQPHAPDGPLYPLLADAVRFDQTGLARIDRQALSRAPADAASLCLGAAILSVSGRPFPPRSDRLTGLLARSRTEPELIATLGGARLETFGAELLIAPEPVDRRRPMTSEDDVFEGRFETTPGVAWVRLAGRAAQLSPTDRKAVQAMPALIRPALPVALDTAGAPRLPHPLGTGPSVRALAAQRFASAVGQIRSEHDLA